MSTVTHAFRITLDCRRAAKRHGLDPAALTAPVLAEYRRTGLHAVARRKLLDLLRTAPTPGDRRA